MVEGDAGRAAYPLGFKLALLIALKLLFLAVLYYFVVRPQLHHADAQSTALHLTHSAMHP